MKKNQDTLFRHWHLLRCLPRYPQKKSVKDIAASLSYEGFNVSERTIQRDLQELSVPFQLYCYDKSRPFGWGWGQQALRFDLPGMVLDEALAWGMLEKHLQMMLPYSATKHLLPYFKSARQRLNQETGSQRVMGWMDKIRILQPNQPLIPPHIDTQVHNTVSEALFKERQLQVCYRKKNYLTTENYQIHPLALIQRGDVLYLYARLFDYPDARSLALHRIEQAEILDEPAIYPENFDLDDCVNRGVWGFGGDKLCDISIRFYDHKGDHLNETPLTRNQKIHIDDEVRGTLTVSASVPDTPQLRWWILGFGCAAEVLGPAYLRHYLSQTIAKMSARYTSPVDYE